MYTNLGGIPGIRSDAMVLMATSFAKLLIVSLNSVCMLQGEKLVLREPHNIGDYEQYGLGSSTYMLIVPHQH